MIANFWNPALKILSIEELNPATFRILVLSYHLEAMRHKSTGAT